MNNIDIWNINYNTPTQNIIDFFYSNQSPTSTYLLDLQKSSYSLIEHVVHKISMFHFKRLNIEITQNIFVEFWWKTNTHQDEFHLDCDEHVKKTSSKYIHPLLSTVTYFNNHNCPTIITNIDFNTYKFKEFDNQNSLFVSFPRTEKHITFNSTLFHGTSNFFYENDHIEPRYILAINLWNQQPQNIDYYNPDITTYIDNSEISITQNKNTPINQYVSPDFIDFNFFQSLLYNRTNNLFLKFGKLLQLPLEYDSFLFIKDDPIKNNLQLSLNHDQKNIAGDIQYILDHVTNIKYNRFFQRFLFSNIYTPDICKWIINESELYAKNNGGWITNRHNAYPTTDLPVHYIKSIFNFICETFETISYKIKDSYELDENIKINFTDVFVVKYKLEEQHFLEMHQDGSFLSFQILLSNNTDFEGGGTYFEDGLTMKPKQGDLILHSSKIKHSGLPITKGIRYILVGFVDLIVQPKT